VAALIAWMLIVRVDELVKNLRPPKAAALRAALDEIINTNRMPSMRSRPLSRPFNMLLLYRKPLPHRPRSAI